ncbi:MAG: hypothetical protein GF344_00975, partial [Chitinivibrionales bacterium]|nr:hypothetical protein [Chitinivibrionales bacterium]MBD3355678.1 hypothetical protein [Chitinivibrionales bacterium]
MDYENSSFVGHGACRYGGLCTVLHDRQSRRQPARSEQSQLPAAFNNVRQPGARRRRDTITADTLTVVFSGNREENIFRWRLEHPVDTGAWSPWEGRGDLDYTVTLYDIKPGAQALRVQTTYDPGNEDLCDTVISFVKLAKPEIVEMSAIGDSLTVGTPCTLWVKATGTEPLSYQWYRDTTMIAGATDDTLTTGVRVAADSAVYRCIVSSEQWGSDSAVFAFRVVNDNPNYESPSMTFDDRVLAPGDTITADSLAVEFTGNSMETIFRWWLEHPEDTTEWTSWTGNDEHSYTIILTDLNTGTQALRVQCAYDPQASDVCDTVIAFVKMGGPVEPAVVSQSKRTVQIAEGSACTLWVSATGVEPLVYEWYREDVRLDGRTGDTVVISSFDGGDAGSYLCIVSNALGADTSDTFNLSLDDGLNHAPRWTGDTLRVAAAEGETITVELADSCTDSDGDELVFELVSSQIDGDSLSSTGGYSYSSGFDAAGEYIATIDATDGKASSRVVMRIIIDDTNRLPMFYGLLENGVYQINEGERLSVSFRVEDSDNNTIEIFIIETTLPREDQIELSDTSLQ